MFAIATGERVRLGAPMAGRVRMAITATGRCTHRKSHEATIHLHASGNEQAWKESGEADITNELGRPF